MTYKIISVDEKKEKVYLWGTFSEDKEKMFLFTSYLLGMNDTSNFFVHELETDKVCKLSAFAEHYGITKDDTMRNIVINTII